MRIQNGLLKKILLGVLGAILTAIPLSLAYTPTFSDMELGDANFEAIEYLVKTETLQGYSDGTFKPDQTINRAELMKILVAGQGIEPDTTLYKDCYPDVGSEWFAPYICYATEQGWVNGYPDGTFLPGNTVNKVEAIKMLVNSQGLSESLPSSVNETLFIDTDNDAWYAPYLHVAKNANLLEENGAYYDPSGSMNRGGVAENLFRARAMLSLETDTYTLTARNAALNSVGLESLVSEKTLFVAEVYNIDTEGTFTTQTYHQDDDGYFSLESFTNAASLIVGTNYELNDEGNFVVSAEQYILDEDGVASLHEYESSAEEDLVIFVVYGNEVTDPTESSIDPGASSGETTLDDISFQAIDLAEIEVMETIETTGEESIEEESPEEEETADADDSTQCPYWENLGYTCWSTEYYGWATQWNYSLRQDDDAETYGEEVEIYTLYEAEEENAIFIARLRRLSLWNEAGLVSDTLYLKDLSALAEYQYEKSETWDYDGTTTSVLTEIAPVSQSHDGSGFIGSVILAQIAEGTYEFTLNFSQASVMDTDASQYHEAYGESETTTELISLISSIALEGTIENDVHGTFYGELEERDQPGYGYANTVEITQWSFAPVNEALEETPSLVASTTEGALTQSEWDGWIEATLYEMQYNR